MNFSANLNKVFIYIQALLEKFEKEKEKNNSINELDSTNKRKVSDIESEDIENDENKDFEKQDKLGTKYNPILPVCDWDEICKESYKELESNIKLREDLITTEFNLKSKVNNFFDKNIQNFLKKN